MPKPGSTCWFTRSRWFTAWSSTLTGRSWPNWDSRHADPIAFAWAGRRAFEPRPAPGPAADRHPLVRGSRPGRFPALRLAREACKAGGRPLSQRGERSAVDAFLNRRIGFLDIERVVEETLEACPTIGPGSSAMSGDDQAARRHAGTRVAACTAADRLRGPGPRRNGCGGPDTGSISWRKGGDRWSRQRGWRIDGNN